MRKKSFFNRLFSTIESRAWPFRVSWAKTLYFNLRSMPLSLAIKMPVYIYRNTEFVTLSGIVEINGDIRMGMVRIGKREDRGQGVTIVRNMGKMILSDGVKIMQGCDIYVGREGRLEIGENVRIRENVFLYVSQFVSIGEGSGIAYQTTISDNDFHFVMDTENGRIDNCVAPIIIGKRNWIGSRTVIKKGTITPDNIIVASSYSLLGKDYRESVPEYSVIGGVPAKLLRENYRRVFNIESELAIHKYFDSNDSPYFFNVDAADEDEFCS